MLFSDAIEVDHHTFDTGSISPMDFWVLPGMVLHGNTCLEPSSGYFLRIPRHYFTPSEVRHASDSPWSISHSIQRNGKDLNIMDRPPHLSSNDGSRYALCMTSIPSLVLVQTQEDSQ